mmetsp:Transcript_2930/g.9975  ORF Transcript_2930/g.9975 Transcript_2930/m.9975 type:complete len:290 (+) Transcript_2930:1037-1906(+)
MYEITSVLIHSEDLLSLAKPFGAASDTVFVVESCVACIEEGAMADLHPNDVCFVVERSVLWSILAARGVHGAVLPLSLLVSHALFQEEALASLCGVSNPADRKETWEEMQDVVLAISRLLQSTKFEKWCQGHMVQTSDIMQRLLQSMLLLASEAEVTPSVSECMKSLPPGRLQAEMTSALSPATLAPLMSSVFGDGMVALQVAGRRRSTPAWASPRSLEFARCRQPVPLSAQKSAPHVFASDLGMAQPCCTSLRTSGKQEAMPSWERSASSQTCSLKRVNALTERRAWS